uniref:Uncharacterized protein n=1 Tax=Anguilla anguilla TaxID=7936 RepID=A0A0E9RNR0_ANGAN
MCIRQQVSDLALGFELLFQLSRALPILTTYLYTCMRSHLKLLACICIRRGTLHATRFAHNNGTEGREVLFSARYGTEQRFSFSERYGTGQRSSF